MVYKLIEIIITAACFIYVGYSFWWLLGILNNDETNN